MLRVIAPRHAAQTENEQVYAKQLSNRLGRDMAHVATIFSLVQEKTRRIPGPEIDGEFQMSLVGDCLQIFCRGRQI